MSVAAQSHPPPGHGLAITRWKRGHQSFHIQLIIINTLIEDSLATLEAGDYSQLARCLSRLSVLYDASTATMRYAADFPRELYQDFVRPSMMPPFVSPGFSGILNTEHNVMIEGLKRLARALNKKLGRHEERWPAEVAQAWASLGEAQAHNRNNHSLICHKFVDTGVSLLKQFYADKRLLRESAEVEEDV